MSNVVQITPAAAFSPLAELQKAFALLDLGGELRLINRQEIDDLRAGILSRDLSMYNRQNGNEIMERHLETLPYPSDIKRVIKQFRASPKTLMYKEIAFSPLPTPDDTLNLWVGPTATPAEGNWSILGEFLREVVCNGDDAAFTYLIGFLAHMLQFPETKPGIIIALLGGQGTGKGTLFALIRAIWSLSTLAVSDVEHVIGSFNAALERNYVVCMDEALFQGDKKALDRLKSMVTEPTITIEQKHQPRRTIHSFHRFFAASNHDHFASVEADDRRFLFLRVSETRKGDHTYWKEVHEAIADPAIVGAMVYDLLKRDLSDFNIRVRPKTAEHMDQKLMSLRGFSRYWYEVLQSGSLNPSGNFFDWPAFVSTEDLMNFWNNFEVNVRRYSIPQQRELRRALEAACPSAAESRKKIIGLQRRGYILPPLPQARAEFARMMGGDIDWDD